MRHLCRVASASWDTSSGACSSLSMVWFCHRHWRRDMLSSTWTRRHRQSAKLMCCKLAAVLLVKHARLTQARAEGAAGQLVGVPHPAGRPLAAGQCHQNLVQHRRHVVQRHAADGVLCCITEDQIRQRSKPMRACCVSDQHVLSRQCCVDNACLLAAGDLCWDSSSLRNHDRACSLLRCSPCQR